MTASQLRNHADHFESLVVVRNHASMLADALADSSDPDIAEMARALQVRIHLANAVECGEA